jgi:two-component system KDP operon response regulator KdpE
MTLALVADDDPTVLALAAEILATAGYEVLSASDGRAALTIAVDERVHVALLDVDMPGVDGITVMRTLRERLPSVRVVIMSGDHGHEAAAINGGAVAFVRKPFTVRGLSEAIHRAMGR